MHFTQGRLPWTECSRNALHEGQCSKLTVVVDPGPCLVDVIVAVDPGPCLVEVTVAVDPGPCLVEVTVIVDPGPCLVTVV